MGKLEKNELRALSEESQLKTKGRLYRIVASTVMEQKTRAVTRVQENKMGVAKRGY